MKKTIISLFFVGSIVIGCSSGNNESTDASIQLIETLPLREVKDISIFIEQIKADSAWLNMVEKKAEEQGIPFEEMIKMDAQYLIELDIQIVQIENDIINNPEWLALVKQKAQEQGISLDDAIRADAEYMFNTRKDTLQ